MWRFIKRFLQFLLILVIFAIFVVVVYFFIQDVNATRAKDYFLKEHDFKKTDIIAYKVTEYVYDEDQDCGSLWFKECTKEENLKKKSYFYIFKSKQKFVVTEYEDGTYTDNYEE